MHEDRDRLAFKRANVDEKGLISGLLKGCVHRSWPGSSFSRAFLVGLMFLAAGCASAPPSALPTTLPAAGQVPTETVVSAIAMPASTDLPEPGVFDRTLLVAVGFSLWRTERPYKEAQLLIKEEDMVYGDPIWSADGERFAFARATQPCPHVGSIWIGRSDGTDIHQIGPEVTGRTNPDTGDCDLIGSYPIAPISFTMDGRIATYDLKSEDRLALLDPESGQIESVPLRQSLVDLGIEVEDENYLRSFRWMSFSNKQDRVWIESFASGYKKSIPLSFWIDLSSPEDVHLLKPPEAFKHVYDFDPPAGAAGWGVWSPDGKQLLMPDEDDGMATLWVVDVETNAWSKVAEHPVQGEIDWYRNAKWSPDGKWVAWYSEGGGYQEHQYRILFLNPSSWEIERITTHITNNWSKILGWVQLDNGESRFVASKDEPVAGFYWLFPDDETKDELFLSYDQLDQLFGPDWWFGPQAFQPLAP